jgi:hypothetical protein
LVWFADLIIYHYDLKIDPLTGRPMDLRARLLVLAMTAVTPGLVEAQDYWCDRPRKPDLPYGARVVELEAAQYEVEAYVQKMRRYTECLALEIDSATAEAKRVIREWNLLVSTVR